MDRAAKQDLLPLPGGKRDQRIKVRKLDRLCGQQQSKVDQDADAQARHPAKQREDADHHAHPFVRQWKLIARSEQVADVGDGHHDQDLFAVSADADGHVAQREHGDEAHDARQKFVDWQSIAAGQGNEITGGKPAEYKKSAIVRQYARDAKTVTKEIEIKGLWPTNVGELQLDWDSNNEIQTFEVTLALDYWE